MQIAICDDEKSIGLILEEKIKKLLPDAVIDKYLSGDELIASGCEPDILFFTAWASDGESRYGSDWDEEPWKGVNMGLGVENSANAYQNYRYQQNKTTGQANHLDFNKILSAKEGDNTEKVQKPNENSVSKVDTYTEYLKAKYGNIMIQNVGSDQKSMDSLGTWTYGMNNIVIAPNVLETMANDPKKAAYYEKMIQDFFASQSTVKAQMAVGGFEIQSYGMVIHPDGTAHYYVCGDVSPEKKAKIEAQMKAEDEEKAKRRRQYLERSEEAAEKRRQIEEINMQKSKKDAAFDDNISAVNVLSEVDRAVAIAAYENIANTFNENIIKSTIDN